MPMNSRRGVAYPAARHKMTGAHFLAMLSESTTAYSTNPTSSVLPPGLAEGDAGQPDGDSKRNGSARPPMNPMSVKMDTATERFLKPYGPSRNSHPKRWPTRGSNMQAGIIQSRNLKCQPICWFPSETGSEISSISPDSEEYDPQHSPDRLESRLKLEQPVVLEEGPYDLEMQTPSDVASNDTSNLNSVDLHPNRVNAFSNEKPPAEMDLVLDSRSDSQCDQEVLGDQIAEHKEEVAERDQYSAEVAEDERESVQQSPIAQQSVDGDKLDQTHSKPTRDATDQSELMRSKEIIHRILEELVTTERSYCHLLYVFSEVVAKNVCTKSGVSLKELRLLFPRCLPDLYAMHVDMLGKMEANMKMFSKSTERPAHHVSNKPPFIVLLEAFELEQEKHLTDQLHSSEELHILKSSNTDSRFYTLYKRYFSEFSVAMETMRKLTRQSSRFRQTLKRLQQHPECEGFDFSAFLLAPIQRLPRYLLLMKQLTRHLTKLASTEMYIGNTEANVTFKLARMTEQYLHAILVCLDAQLAGHREQPKGGDNALVASERLLCETNKSRLESTNINQIPIFPCTDNQLCQNGDGISRGPWTRVRRAFSENRPNPLSDESMSTLDRDSCLMTQSYNSSSIRTKLCGPNNKQNDTMVKRPLSNQFAINNGSDNSLHQRAWQHATDNGFVEDQLLSLDGNPVEELISCVTAGRVSADVRRSIRRQTVGGVTHAMKEALFTRPKYFSLNHTQSTSGSHTNMPSTSQDRSHDTSPECSRQECSPKPVTPLRIQSFTERWPCMPPSADQYMTNGENNTGVRKKSKLKRVNTFPSKRITSLLRLQRRKSEPCSASPPPLPQSDTRITSIPEDLLETTLEDHDSPNNDPNQYLVNEVSLSSPSLPDCEIDIPSVPEFEKEPIHKTRSHNATVHSWSTGSTTGTADSVIRATSHPYRVSDGGDGLQPKYRQSMQLMYSNDDSRMIDILQNNLTTMKLTTKASYKSSTKKTISSWKTVLQNLFRRKTTDKFNSGLRNQQLPGKRKRQLPPMHSFEQIKSDVNQFIACRDITYDLQHAADKVLNPKEQRMSHDSNTHDLEKIGCPKSGIRNDSLSKSHLLSSVPQQIQSESINELCRDLKIQLDRGVMGDLVFLDETGNPCFDI